jgi:2-keto-3-deoxy-L-arabinonate dehydratase
MNNKNNDRERALTGVYPILNTTFHEDGSLDLESQERLTEYLLECGAHGLGLFANASEGYALTSADRRVLWKSIQKVVNGRVPLVVSAGHTGTDAAVQNARIAEANGATALMMLPPYYLKTNGDGIMFYYEAISKAVNIPIMVQDAPLMTQVAMPASLITKMSREFEHVKYVKVEAPPTPRKITEIIEAGSTATLFAGLNGQFLIEEYERGARGVMPGSDMIPELTRIWSQLEAGDADGAWRIFAHILPLIRFELQPGLGVSAMKHNLAARGVIRCPKVRHPTAELDAAGLRELERHRKWIAQLDDAAPRRPQDAVQQIAPEIS